MNGGDIHVVQAIQAELLNNNCVPITVQYSGLFWSDPRLQAVAVLPPHPPPPFSIVLRCTVDRQLDMVCEQK